MNKILKELDDDMGVAIRQCLLKINLILIYKIELSDIIENKLRNLDLSKYKDSMQTLIKKDIENVLQFINYK